MRTGLIGIAIVCLILGATAPAGADVYAKTGFHLDWWRSDAGRKGLQYHVPIEAGGRARNFSFKLLTAHVYNRVDAVDGTLRTFSGLVDTKANLAYEVVERLPLDLMLAVDFNLPTGKTGLAALDVISIADSDKVTITRMGEGFNVNPSLSLVKQWGGFLAAAGVGYIWRGEYDAADSLRDYDPGNAFNVNAELVYNFNPQWLARLYGSYTSFAKDRVNGQAYYTPGDVRIGGGGIRYSRATWDAEASLTAILRGKERRQGPGGDLLPEERNAYGDEWRAQLEATLHIAPRLDLKARASYLTVAANDYPVSDAFHVTKRTKTALGAELLGRLTPRWQAGLRLEGYLLRIDDNPERTNNEIDHNGVSAALWLAATF